MPHRAVNAGPEEVTFYATYLGVSRGEHEDVLESASLEPCSD